MTEIARNHLTKEDVVALGFRRAQLEIFEKLLQDDSFFDAKMREWNVRGKEAVWQKFFEDNPSISAMGSITYPRLVWIRVLLNR